jgi:hypothetical protein
MRPGDRVVWVADAFRDVGVGEVKPGDEGRFVDFEADPHHLVVSSAGYGTFVCERHEVRPA